MRGIQTPVSELRRKIFAEITKIAFEENGNINDAIEAVPYTVCPGDTETYRESIYRERAIASERVRLAMGMSLRPEDRPVHVTSGLEESNISEHYYEPPLMQVIPSACNKCEENIYRVSNMCKGCVAHPCMQVCPKNAISRVNGKAYIDESKCIKCGKCKNACPYDAISKLLRPCAEACGVKAIESDDQGRAKINIDKCVSCGMCMVSCPFGAVADKSQVFQLARSLKTGDKIVAELAPAYAGQFGADVTPGQVKLALQALGFAEVREVALGADIGAIAEAKHYAEHVATGELPFLLTSCCPSWSMLAKTQFPEMIESVSRELTPMVATARRIKHEDPNAKVVFIGPCAAKKLEATRRTVRSDVDFVITFEELSAMFEARNIVPAEMDKTVGLHDATAAGRGYACAGGVAEAIEKCVKEYYPDVEVKIQHAEGLADCKKMLTMAKLGKMNGCMIEGMGCPGGCVAGAGTLLPIAKAKATIDKIKKESTTEIPDQSVIDVDLS
jgi:[FeFe] hydrogenase (group B1/B3)